jgi:uroporphyrinogen-III decarboxylase
MSTLAKYEKTILEMVTDCANAGQKLSQSLAMMGNMDALYLYYKPSSPTENGVLQLVPDSATAPDGFVLATGEGLRCNVAYSDYFRWVKARVNRLPILAHNL